MARVQYNKLSLDKISEYSETYVIRNFILSNHVKPPSDFSSKMPFVFDGIIFSLCIRGWAKIRINFKEYEVNPDTIVILIPQHMLTLIEKSDDFLVKSLFFSFDFIAKLSLYKDLDTLRNISRNPCIAVAKEVKQELLEMHAFIVKKYNKTDHNYREEIATALLYALILEVASIYNARKPEEEKASSRQEEITQQFFKLLLENYKERRNVSFYADKMCITPKYLSSTVKRVTGKSIYTWINEIIIVEAKTQLKTTSLTVQQLSGLLNFPNPSFFGRFFKKHTNVTPLKYRNS